MPVMTAEELAEIMEKLRKHCKESGCPGCPLLALEMDCDFYHITDEEISNIREGKLR